ncbi:hypothetical protein Z043_123002, partial [Scleropages formosus]
MWVCNLCRKQQEILTKSGAWFYSGGSNAAQRPGITEESRGPRHEEAPREKKAKLQGAPPFQEPSGDATAPVSDRNRPQGLPRQESLRSGPGSGDTPGDSLALPPFPLLIFLFCTPILGGVVGGASLGVSGRMRAGCLCQESAAPNEIRFQITRVSLRRSPGSKSGEISVE